VSGSLAGLLWLDTAQRLGVEVDARAYTRIGWRIGLPVLAAAAATLAVTNRLLSSPCAVDWAEIWYQLLTYPQVDEEPPLKPYARG
jgi:hypothetical protein